MDGSGHIDMAVLRDGDDPELFASAADGGLESREDYLQNGLADVAALIDPRRGPLVYTNDALNRLKKADEGHKSGGSIGRLTVVGISSPDGPSFTNREFSMSRQQ